MAKKDKSIAEGFWYSKEEPQLPKPIAGNPWEGQDKFLRKLGKLQAKIGLTAHYKGYSHCRLCDKVRNGSGKYHYKGWVWPQGYFHYLEKHNVEPSPDFYNMVMGIKPKNDIADVGAISDAIANFKRGETKKRELTPQQFALQLVEILPKFCKTFNAMHAMPPEFWQAMLGKMFREDVLGEKE